MNQTEEVPESLGGLGDLLPADVLKMVNFFNEPDEQSGTCSDSAMARKSRMKFNELLEQLHRADKDHQGSKIEFVYVASGGQHVETQINIGKEPKDACKERTPLQRAGGVDSPEASKSLPDELASEKAMALWRKVQLAGYVDEHYQPLLSRTQAALLADAMAERLGIREKWKVFEVLWQRKNMYRDYYDALNQRKSLAFQDELEKLFS